MPAPVTKGTKRSWEHQRQHRAGEKNVTSLFIMVNLRELFLFSLQRECADTWICSNCSNLFGTFALLETHQCITKDKALITSFRPANNLGPPKAKGETKEKLKETGLDTSIVQRSGAVSCSPSTKPTCASSGSVCSSIVRFVPTWRNGQSSLLKEREVKQPDSYPCQVCGKIFVSVEKLTAHTYTHTGECSYRCSQQGCTKSFISKYKLIRYIF